MEEALVAENESAPGITRKTVGVRDGVSGSVLKLVAVITMLIDHLAAYLCDTFPEFFRYRFAAVSGLDINVYWIMRTVGRTAFPLFGFLIVEGYLHTRNRLRYAITLLIGALVSELPFDLLQQGRWYQHQNVFFTLLFGMLGIWCLERFRDRKWLQAVAVIGLFALSFLFGADYGVRGYSVIVLFYLLRMEYLALGIVGSLLLGIRTIAAYVLIAFYNGKRGFVKGTFAKYAFYAFYPVHLMILYLIRCLFS